MARTHDPTPSAPPASGLDVRRLLETAGGDAALIETHISWVLLIGAHAYKIRRPVRLPFLDFTRLEARRADCERELALNRRWAPSLYLGLVPVVGTPQQPRLHDPAHAPQGGEDPPIDYAVKMRRFPDGARLDRVAAAGGLGAALVDALADGVAELHRDAPRATADRDFGTPAAIAREVQGNLDLLQGWEGLADRATFETVRDASHDGLARLDAVFRARRATGAVRECHGDLHLENIALVEGRPLPFDGVEFEPAFRWVDVASDLAFLLMDLHARGHEALAHRLLDRWLQRSGDYGALRVLAHYLRYRALVRAKVAAIRSRQDAGQAEAASAQGNRLVALAAGFGDGPGSPALILTHGVSGSGKSHLARALVMRLGAVCLRSDVERARLFSDGPRRYAPAASDSTYARLATLARLTLETGRSAIVDATFLDPGRRAPFRDVAAALGVPFAILDLHAPRETLQRRVAQRAARGDDASQADAAVLAAQCRTRVALAHDDAAAVLRVDTGRDVDVDAVARWMENLTGRPLHESA